MAGALSPQIRILSAGEHRLVTDIGRVDPGSLDSYRTHGGYAGLERAVDMPRQQRLRLLVRVMEME